MAFESCLKLLPRKSYDTYGFIHLSLYILTGIILIAIVGSIQSRGTFQCNPDKTISSNLATTKFINSECFQNYEREFYFSLPLFGLVSLNFGLVMLLSIVYAYLVKQRVGIFENPSSTTTNYANDDTEPLSGLSQAAKDPLAHQRPDRYFVYTLYVIHLFVFRIILLVVFVILLLNSLNFAVQYPCQWPIDTKSTSPGNFTRNNISNHLTLNCTYFISNNNKKLAVAVVAVNCLSGTVALTELVYLLWSALKDRIFCTDMEFCCVYLLKKRKSIRKLMKKIRENVSEELFYLHDDFGDERLSSRKLEKMYVNVMVMKGRESTWSSRRKYKNRHEVYEVYFTAPENATVLTRAEDLFKHKYAVKHAVLPRTILVVGRPGIGKTLLTTKIFYEWQKQVYKFWHGKMVIFIRFRNFNNKQTSLREMLRHSEGFNMSTADFNDIYEYICLMPSKVILVFDGLDELNVDNVSLTEEISVNSYNDVFHPFLIFKQLIQQKLLKGATILATSRPTAEHIYKNILFEREIEVLGFQKKQIKEYVEKFCINDKQKSSVIWNLIKQSPEFLSLCYIPVNSYIVCLTLKESIKIDEEEINEDQINVPKTITELYKRAIKILLFRHHSKYKNKSPPRDYLIAKLPKDMKADLDKLTKIARDGMVKDQLIFEYESGDELIASGLPNCGVFNQLEKKRRNMFCFLHLTIQEFLAARFVVDHDIKNVESFLVNHIDDPKWHLVIQFVCGLLGNKMKGLRPDDERFKDFKDAIDGLRKRFPCWMPKENVLRIAEDNKTLLVIKCMHEMQEDLVVEFNEIDSPERCIMFGRNISPVECTALFEFLSHMKDLYELQILDSHMDSWVFRELGKFLLQNNETTVLKIADVDITGQNGQHIFDALSNEKCKLTNLGMKGNRLGSDGVKRLSYALTSGNCKLTNLVVISNQLGNEGAEHISDALKSGNCKLVNLDIGCNRLTDESAKYLGYALTSGNCKLTNLVVSYNQLGNSGAKHISDALKSGNCKLSNLDMRFNNLSGEGARCLSDALQTDNCKLTYLDIRQNILTDEGAECLSAALRNDNCKLTHLYVANNDLTYNGGKHLRDALKSEKCQLTDLNVSYNKLMNEGVAYLSDALKSDKCKLTFLNIAGNKLTDEGAGYLCDALKSDNFKLDHLDISDNEITDKGAKDLSNALQSDSCKLAILNIKSNKLTHEGAGYLYDAQKSDKCKLTALYIEEYLIWLWHR